MALILITFLLTQSEICSRRAAHFGKNHASVNFTLGCVVISTQRNNSIYFQKRQ